MSEEPVTVRTVESKRDLEAFIRLPFSIHRGHRRWVPPLIANDRRHFDPGQNLAFRYCDTTMALATKEGAVCGRVLGAVNRRHVDRTGDRAARFGYLECPDDPAVSGALLEHVEKWGAGLGMERVVGPMGFTDQDPEGFLVEGFEHEPTVATHCNLPYILELIQRNGYSKEVDYVVYKVPVPSEVPPIHRRIAERTLSRGTYTLIEFRKKREMKPYVRRILELMNETFAGLYGYVPLDEEEMQVLARKYWLVMDPRFVKVVMAGGRDVAFLLAMPNIDPGLRRAGGRLFPFGFLHILNSARRTKQLDLLVAGVRTQDRGHGVDVVGMAAILQSAIDAGFTVIDSHLELETNTRVRAEMERLGGRVCKRYRIYSKPLRTGTQPPE
jgi:hypothetical protein